MRISFRVMRKVRRSQHRLLSSVILGCGVHPVSRSWAGGELTPSIMGRRAADQTSYITCHYLPSRFSHRNKITLLDDRSTRYEHLAQGCRFVADNGRRLLRPAHASSHINITASATRASPLPVRACGTI